MRYRVLACDYDGTIAHHGVVSEETVRALKKAAQSGRKLVLVTGRELHDLLAAFPEADVFDCIVAENGGVLYEPATREERPLAPPPPPALISTLHERGVHPLSIGRVVVATWEPHETVVLEAIRDLELDLHVSFNKGAVMVLPDGVNKKSGLEAALHRLGLSLHNTVGVGDAENDHAFLTVCECAVAVANALHSVKEECDWVTAQERGAGVEELVERLLEDDLESLGAKLTRHHVLLGRRDDGSEVTLAPYGSVVLVAGGSGSGKSTAVTGLLERLSDRGYQVCIIDPEGDYEGFDSAVIAGSPEQPPDADQVLQILRRAEGNAVVNLLGVPAHDRPQFFLHVLSRLQELRASTGRPHWLVLDEAHHMLGSDFEPAGLALPQDLGSLLFITVHPDQLQRALLERVTHFIGVGTDAVSALESFARALGTAQPEIGAAPEQQGQGLVWFRDHPRAERLTMPPGSVSRRRHRRKYAHGELGPDKSFYFRGSDGRLNLRAHNLVVFNTIAEGVDDETWLYHLRRGHYSEWLRDSIKDPELADQVATVESDASLSPAASRRRIRDLVDRRYTLPA
ncbi:MAG TPA: HAD-IIB family hydrolase [Polyangiaceae bacterium]|nr:HAD-IIB family hydrolase [Polyangiaceae bacterium]